MPEKFEIPAERLATHEEVIDYMTTACRYAEIAVTPKKVAVLIRLHQEIMDRRGEITLSEIRQIREQLDEELRDIEKVKKKRATGNRVQKQGDRQETFIETNIKGIIQKLPDIKDYRNG